MIIGYFHKDCIVELENKKKIKISELQIGDNIKSVNDNFCHLYKNKLDYIADNKNIVYNKVIGLPQKTNKSVWKLWNDDGDSIICALSTFFRTMQRSKGLNTYFSVMLGAIFDEYESIDGEIFNFVMSYGFSSLYDFKPQVKEDLIGIELEMNKPVFINNFLIG